MKIRVQDGLPYITIALTYRGRQLVFEKVILDTGSTGTIFTADKLADIGLLPEPQDAIHRVWGVRGTEFVFMKRVDRLTVGELEGIMGMDFLLNTGAIIDLAQMEISR